MCGNVKVPTKVGEYKVIYRSYMYVWKCTGPYKSRGIQGHFQKLCVEMFRTLQKLENTSHLQNLLWKCTGPYKSWGILEYWQSQEGPRWALCKFTGAKLKFFKSRSKVTVKVTCSKFLMPIERLCHKEHICQICKPYLLAQTSYDQC